jgi:hypothetical protein
MQATAGSTTVAHRAYTDDGGIWRLVADYAKDSSVAKRCAIAFCITASAVGWAAIIGLMLLLGAS